MRTFYTIIAGTILICSSVFGSCSKITQSQNDVITEVKLVRAEGAGDKKLTELRMQIMEKRLDLMDAQINSLNKSK